MPETTPSTTDHYTLFEDYTRQIQGPREAMVQWLRGHPDAQGSILVFEDATGTPVDLDLREGVFAPAPDPAPGPRGVGRPKLGVVAREVTLLPRHWDWLNRQPGGASVALRRLVEDARRVNQGRDAARSAREAAYRCMSALAGSLPGFEEAARALFASDPSRFASLLASWPSDVATYVTQLASASWSDDAAQ